MSDDEFRETRLRWHYGPTESDPDPGTRWHYDCGGEVLVIEGALVCSKCGQSDE